MSVIKNILFSSLTLFVFGCGLFVSGTVLLGYLEFNLPPIDLNNLVTSIDGSLVLLLLVIGLSLIGFSIGLISMSLRWPLASWRPPSFKTLFYKHLLILVLASNFLAFIPLAQGRVITVVDGPAYQPTIPQEINPNGSFSNSHPNDKPSTMADIILKVTVAGMYDAYMLHTASSKVRINYFTILIILSILLAILLPWKQGKHSHKIE